ncbi:unnamed protein product [Staurois parvus]|uniref:Uncharacterized protein n=1 Tax=Staurois parvus TaxID=386267 RepID=A0ABN9BSP1_9NEOB|nr:unnamed protein product [Staurois parvus]
MVPYCWCYLAEWCVFISVSRRSSASSLVSVGGIMPHHWCQWEE